VFHKKALPHLGVVDDQLAVDVSFA